MNFDVTVDNGPDEKVDEIGKQLSNSRRFKWLLLPSRLASSFGLSNVVGYKLCASLCTGMPSTLHL